MRRRTSPSLVAATLILLHAAVAGGRVSAQEGALSVRELRPTVHVVSGFENGNVLVLASDSALLLVDAQSGSRVAALDSVVRAIARRTPSSGAGASRPVRLVIDTHYHGDHTEGNAWFRARGASVLAHREAIVAAAKDTTIASWDNWHRTPLPAEAMPTRAVDDSLVIAFGAEQVVVLHAPGAHTGGDLMVWLPRANVLHIGDILEVGAPPFIDWWSGGSLRGMVAAIDRVLALVNDRTAIVPGHGAVSTRGDLARYRTMLVTVEARVAAQVAGGATLAQVLASRPAREWEASMGGERRAGHFVRLVFHGATRPR